jgi:hypothetical protein
MKKTYTEFRALEIIIVVFILVLMFSFVMKGSFMVEKSRIARAKIRINAMSKLGYAYYLKNNSLEDMQNCDVWEITFAPSDSLSLFG